MLIMCKIRYEIFILSCENTQIAQIIINTSCRDTQMAKMIIYAKTYLVNF